MIGVPVITTMSSAWKFRSGSRPSCYLGSRSKGMKAQKRFLYEWRNPSVEKRHLQKAKAEQEEMIVTE